MIKSSEIIKGFVETNGTTPLSTYRGITDFSNYTLESVEDKDSFAGLLSEGVVTLVFEEDDSDTVLNILKL